MRNCGALCGQRDIFQPMTPRWSCCISSCVRSPKNGKCRHVNGAKPRPNSPSYSTNGSSRRDGHQTPNTNFGQSYSDHRALPNPHQRGAPLLEHPARKLQSRRRRADASAATKHVATRLLDHLLNLNNASRRRLPPIQNLALFGCVGVLSPRSTSPEASIRRCDISANGLRENTAGRHKDGWRH